MNTVPDWWPNWSGEPCVIVGSGPSAASAPLKEARGKAKFLVINNSWVLAPWADVLYGCDFSWWVIQRGVPDFPGLKLSQDLKCRRMFPDIRIVTCNRKIGKSALILEPPGMIGWGGNGGFQALNLAIQFGSKKIVLVGFDMSLVAGVHWHGKHPKGLNNPREKHVERWRSAMDGISGSVKQMGIEIVNASMQSALRSYPKMPLASAL